MNVCVFTGRLTRDPEVRYSQSGKAVGNFDIAVRKRFVTEGGKEANFIKITCFGKTAEFVEKYFSKGMMVAVSGELNTGNYKNRDGVTIPTAEIYADNVDFCESRSKASNSGAQSRTEANKTDNNGFMHIPDGIDEELPFN